MGARLTRYAVRVIGRPYHYATDRAKIDLGFEPRIDLREGVRRWIETAGADPRRESSLFPSRRRGPAAQRGRW